MKLPMETVKEPYPRRHTEMSKSGQSKRFLLVSLSLALLFSLFLLAACGTGTISSLQTTPAAVNTFSPATAVGDKTTPVPELLATTTPNGAVRFDCASVNQIPFAECTALVALYTSTNGPDWADNSGWLATNTPCTWSGITCEGGHVRAIHLLYNELTGTLPPELGNLSQLSTLGLWVNQLRGPIPVELGELSALGFLDLSGNRLTGPLPAELGELANLQMLSLAHNQLSGPIPSALGKLGNLHSLDLSYNQLSGAIPAELDDLVNLNTLRLSYNQLNGTIPAVLGSLSKLTELDLSYNQLRGAVPESVTQIAQRSLWGNRLEGTVTGNGQDPIAVDYGGVYFTADPSLAVSVWPEVIPATFSPDGDFFWYAAPEHVRFTFANPPLLPGRSRMGINLASEAQILVYPVAGLAELDPLVQEQVEALQSLLAERGPVPEDVLPLLPLTNAAQVFHAQAQYLEFGNIQGLRFISQHSQDPHPIMLSQRLFYTFQGFTDDDTYYVAAFFPLTTPALPDTIEVEDWEAFHANYDTYLLETTVALDQLPPAEFTPDLTLLDAVVTSLRVEPDSAFAPPGRSSSTSGTRRRARSYFGGAW